MKKKSNLYDLNMTYRIYNLSHDFRGQLLLLDLEVLRAHDQCLILF